MKRWMWWLGAAAMIAVLILASRRGPSPALAVPHPESTESEPGVMLTGHSPARPAPPPDLKPADWKERWDDVRADSSGKSLGNLWAPFDAALGARIAAPVLDCARRLPAGSGAVDLTVELFLEAEASGLRVVHAELPATQKLEASVRRCIESAFEQEVPLAHPGVATGTLYHLALPLRLQPVKAPGE